MPNLTAADGWFVLHGPAFKAAITRNCAPFLHELATRYCVGATPRDICLRGLTAALVEVYRCLYEFEMFPTDEEVATFRAACLEFGRCFMRLRELARRAHVYGFQCKPKVHKLQHLPFIMEHINPRWVQCYDEESIIGTVVATWKGSKAGRYHANVQKVVLTKRLVAVFLRFDLGLAG